MKRLSFAITAILFAVLACNMPTSQSTDAASTAAAQTVAVQLTNLAQTQAAGAPATDTPQPNQPTATYTNTAAPSATPQPASATPRPCNLASFVADVTYPDDSPVVVGQSFTKTWRFQNVGTCSWNSAYQLVFDHGDQMGGPVSQALSGIVPPGATVDISVNLVAPSSHGTYQGFWRFRDPTNVLFGLNTGSFWVKIKAVDLTPTPTLPPAVIAVTVHVPIVFGESGAVGSDGTTNVYPNFGDKSDNTSWQGLISFDMTGIPSNAHLTDVKVNFSNFDTLGNPFGALGYMRLYAQNYGSVDASDYFSGSATGALMRWASTGELGSTAGGTLDNGLLNFLQSRVGASRAQFRVQFNDTATNNDGVTDMVRLGNAIYFIVTYTTP